MWVSPHSFPIRFTLAHPPSSTHSPRVGPNRIRCLFNSPSFEAIITIKTAAHTVVSAQPHLRGQSCHWLSHGWSHDRCTTMCHIGCLISRPPPQPTWVLRVPTLIYLLLFALYYLLMPLLLHRTVVPMPSLIPDWRPHICSPVSHSHRYPFSLHVDSQSSSLTIQPFVPMSYEAQRLCVSFVYK